MFVPPFQSRSLWRCNYGAWKAERKNKRTLKPWVLLVSQTTFFHLQNILGETLEPVPQALWKTGGREITGRFKTYRNKRKEKVKVIWCVAILESIMLYHSSSRLDWGHWWRLMAGVMRINQIKFKHESKGVVPVLLSQSHCNPQEKS